MAGKAFGPSGKSNAGRLAIQLGVTALVVVCTAAVVAYFIIAKFHRDAAPAGPAVPAGPGTASAAITVTSGKLVTDNGKPKAEVQLYEDFLCPACASFEGSFGATVAKLIDIGAVAADYYMVTILDSARTQNYSSRAAAAAYCVADESVDAFRRFHSTLYSPGTQPSETAKTFPDNARLIELARQAGAAGTVPDCINSGKYLAKVKGLAAAGKIHATPTVRINGVDYETSTPDALVAKIKGIVGNVPGIDDAAGG